ncbi:MAG TPA: CoB--CoM heterodisulfide reductase iron-sulfur subunit B family protein [Candidatus Wallbacteria bacterium]|nr:CoB--CoM heterodisulfide reductase iron-sulfur subunit B family protein [Candidatus Wallbacteria bacterium]
MKIGYFPGCSLTGSSREYSESLLAVLKKCGVETVELSDWNCCGATAAHNVDRELAISLSARILAIAENSGFNDVLVPCSACYSRLVTARHELSGDPGLMERVSEIIKMKYTGTAVPLNVIEAIDKYAINSIKEKIAKPFAHKVACYYGCLMVRPPKVVNFDRPEDPVKMDEMMKVIGADPVSWAFKTECCGAGFSISRTDTVARLSSKIMVNAEKSGAEAIIVACPMCHVNLDMRRDYIEAYAGKKFDMPVLYVTQAIGLALGIDRQELGLHRHFQSSEISEKASLAPAAPCHNDPPTGASAEE